MTPGSFAYLPGVTSNIVVMDRTARRSTASYERALAKQGIELRRARAQADALLRQRDELMQMREVIRQVFYSRQDAAVRVAALTQRQREVMELVLAGKASKVIAFELSISQRTVENHRASIMKRTGSKSLPALARLALVAAGGATEPGQAP